MSIPLEKNMVHVYVSVTAFFDSYVYPSIVQSMFLFGKFKATNATTPYGPEETPIGFQDLLHLIAL